MLSAKNAVSRTAEERFEEFFKRGTGSKRKLIHTQRDAAAKSRGSLLAEKKAIMRPESVPLVYQANARKKARGEGSSTPRKKYGLDPDTLECPICAEPFSPPVFQVHSPRISTFPHSCPVSSFHFAFNSSFSRFSLTQTGHWMLKCHVCNFCVPLLRMMLCTRS
jgi:hypothetical protein